MSKFFSAKHILLVISLFFILVPFLWMKPGQVDLGGDSSRLYFYDPTLYLKNFSLFAITPEGTGVVSPNFYFLPFLLLLIGLKSILQSPYLLTTVFNSFKLFAGFLAMYFLAKEFLSGKYRDYAAITAGVFYMLCPFLTGNWDKALLSHNQVFLNPLMAFLLLRFFLSGKYKYLWFLLGISFIFAPNFGLTSAPPFFAFYPLMVIFVSIYAFILKKKSIPIKGIIGGVLIFLGLQAFHLIPQFVSLFDAGSFANTRVFDKASIVQEGVRYFIAVLPLAKVSLKFLPISALSVLYFLSIVFPAIIFLGFIQNKKNKSLLLTGCFFLITLFLLSANITHLGVRFYESLFYLPGFSMFRNFIGQWEYVFASFYALLFGQSLAIILQKLSTKTAIVISLVILVITGINSISFISGVLVNPVVWQIPQKHIAQTIDPHFVSTLSYVRSLPTDSKLLTLPLSDSFYQVVPGKDGVYISSSMLSYLAGKQDFDGYQILAPFSDEFLTLAKAKDYDSIKRLLGILNIQYIFINSDPKAYDHLVPDTPYQYVRQFLPANQKEYGEFIHQLSGKEIFQSGSYKIFEVDSNSFLPHIYIPKEVIGYQATLNNKQNVSFIEHGGQSPQLAYVTNAICSKLDICNVSSEETPSVQFLKINPTLYSVTVRRAAKPFVLVFSEEYHNSWKLYPTSAAISPASGEFAFSTVLHDFGTKSVFDNNHFLANGYANAWYIDPSLLGKGQSYTLTLEMTQQRVFYLSAFISIVTLIMFIGWGIVLFRNNWQLGIMGRKYEKKI